MVYLFNECVFTTSFKSTVQPVKQWWKLLGHCLSGLMLPIWKSSHMFGKYPRFLCVSWQIRNKNKKVILYQSPWYCKRKTDARVVQSYDEEVVMVGQGVCVCATNVYFSVCWCIADVVLFFSNRGRWDWHHGWTVGGAAIRRCFQKKERTQTSRYPHSIRTINFAKHGGLLL